MIKLKNRPIVHPDFYSDEKKAYIAAGLLEYGGA